MALPKKMPSQEYLSECFEIFDGILVWKKRPAHHFKSVGAMNTFNSRYFGKQAGRLHCSGYVDVSICKSRFKAHRIVFTMLFGEIPDGFQIDHINGVRNDNRPSNLRLATYQENRYNLKMHADNKSGFKGVVWIPRLSKWRARLAANGVCITLGHFDSTEKAAIALEEARAKHHGDFANNGTHKGVTQ